LNIIPVIDLLHGQAVHALRGCRSNYQPLQSPLCQQGEVVPLIEKFHHDFGMQQIYLADLDAIMGKGNNLPILQTIAHTFPGLLLWIDAGFSSPAAIQKLQSEIAFRPVIGSECWQFRQPFPLDRIILSIDSVDDELRDPSGITGDRARRPDTLILMNLARVGSLQGPDMERLAHWRALAPDAALYMAGGVRHRADLEQLESAGAAGVLLASALHNGALSAADLRHFS